MDRRIWRALLAALALISVTITLSLDNSDSNHPKPKAEVHIGKKTLVDNADQDAKKDNPVELTPSARAVAQGLVEHPGDLAKDKPNAAPLEGTAPQVQEGVIPAPWASDEITGCRTRFLKTNFSARSVPLSRVILFELHYTAGPDIPNSRADVDGLTAFGNQASSRVSWHFNMDKDGNCDYNVPLRSKAWTIANLNSYTINIEVAGRGEEPYLRPGGYRKLAMIIHQVRQAYPGIKLRLGQTDGHCHPTLGGIDSHYRGGPCSGGHSDIKPHNLLAVIARIRAETRKLYPSRPKTSKRDVWLAHRRAVHVEYAAKCPRGRGATAECQALRSRARKLDRLISRQSR